MQIDGRFLPRGWRARRRPAEHLVSRGRVGCPRSAAGDVDLDLDRCYSCPLLAGIRTDDRGLRWVHCRTGFGPQTPAGSEAI